jgi:hypothetical protein
MSLHIALDQKSSSSAVKYIAVVSEINEIDTVFAASYNDLPISFASL